MTIVLGVSALAAVSKQPHLKPTSGNLRSDALRTSRADKNLMKAGIAALSGQVGVQSGNQGSLTPEEATKLANGMKELVNRSTDGLTAVQHADGSVSVDLQDHFQNVAVAKKNPDGTITQACVDNTKAAAAFFQIDQQLFANNAKGGSQSKQQRETKQSIKPIASTGEER